MLTLIRKNVVIKTLALPKLNHLIINLPNLSDDLILANCITQSYDKGGLRMIDIKDFMTALKTTWMRKAVVKSSNYFKPVVSLYVQYLEIRF